MTLKIPKTIHGIDGKKAYERIVNGIPEEQTVIVQPVQNPIMNSNDNFWTINDVQYRNQIYKVDLLKTLLDEGNSKTQDEWIEYSINAKKNNDFFCADMPLQYAIFKALYNSPDNGEKEQARQFIQKSMRETWLSSLSRIFYSPSGNDKIIHNYKIPNEEYETSNLVVGKDRELEVSDKNVLEALVLTKDVDEVKKVLNWINETPVWIWRLNNKPKNVDERVARFSAYDVRAVLNCVGSPSYQDSSLGVRAVGTGNSKLAGGVK